MSRRPPMSPFQVIRQLRHGAHQYFECCIAALHFAGTQPAHHRFHFFSEHGSTVHFDDAQGALHLV